MILPRASPNDVLRGKSRNATRAWGADFAQAVVFAICADGEADRVKRVATHACAAAERAAVVLGYRTHEEGE